MSKCMQMIWWMNDEHVLLTFQVTRFLIIFVALSSTTSKSCERRETESVTSLVRPQPWWKTVKRFHGFNTERLLLWKSESEFTLLPSLKIRVKPNNVTPGLLSVWPCQVKVCALKGSFTASTQSDTIHTFSLRAFLAKSLINKGEWTSAVMAARASLCSVHFTSKFRH